MSYDPSAGLIAAKWEWECTFSAFNFQRLLNGRPAVVYPEVTVYYLKDGATTYTPENCNGKTVYQYDIYEAMQYDTAFSRNRNTSTMCFRMWERNIAIIC